MESSQSKFKLSISTKLCKFHVGNLRNESVFEFQLKSLISPIEYSTRTICKVLIILHSLLSPNRLNCEIDRCRDYCFNNGKCSVETTSNELKCECQFKFKGDRCEIDNRCENCGVDTNNCTIHCHNGGKCIKDKEHHTESCECFDEWKGISCNMLTCLNGECGKCRENSPIESCL